MPKLNPNRMAKTCRNLMNKIFGFSGNLAKRGTTNVENITVNNVRTAVSLPSAPIFAIDVVFPNIEINQIVS